MYKQLQKLIQRGTTASYIDVILDYLPCWARPGRWLNYYLCITKVAHNNIISLH